MSLINQMLQELDARRADVSGGTSFGQQIRAVPEKRGVHPAWWVALALGVMLACVLAYVLLRPAPAAQQGAGHPLRLDVDLNASPLTPSGVQPAGAEPVRLDIAPPVPAEPMTPPSPPAVEAKPAPAPAPLPVPVVQPEAAKESAATHALPVAAVTPVMKPAAPAQKLPEVAAPVPVNKQVKELTPPQRAENEYRKAMLSLQQGKRSEASTGLEQALQFDPKHTGARNAMIGMLLEARRQDEAIHEAREGLEAEPAQPALAMILARLQLEKGELRPAIDTLERTLPHATQQADYLAFLAALLQRDGRHKQAVEQYLLALQKMPQNGIWWMGLGISLQAERRVPEAVESFKRARASNSLSAELLAFVEARLSQLQQ